MKVKNEEEIVVGGSFEDLIPRPLEEKDKLAFQAHVMEVEKFKGRSMSYWFENGWDWKRQIIKNYCQRTGVSFDKLMKYVLCPYWKQIEIHLRRMGKV